jgi:hypothetical protein
MDEVVAPLEAKPKEKNSKWARRPASKKESKRVRIGMRVGSRKLSAHFPETTKRGPKSR